MSTRRVALVTGGARGIGKAIAIRLAEDPSGIDVAILDVEGKESLLAAVVEEIESKGSKGLWITGDVSVEQDVQRAIERTVSELKSLDIMVSNAGTARIIPLIETTVEDWNKIHSVNALGTMLCFKHAAIQMIKQGRGGRIIGACSTVGKQAGPNFSAYGSSKFAVRGLTQAAAQELKPHNITVNSYAPGLIRTPLVEELTLQLLDNAGSHYEKTDGEKPELQGATPDVVAELVAFLIKPQAYYLTGQSIIIDGGMIFD